jgi:hypothetical protein
VGNGRQRHANPTTAAAGLIRLPAPLHGAPAAVTLAAAELPWVGKWKLNVAKSNYGEWTVTYAEVGAGEMQATADGT